MKQNTVTTLRELRKKRYHKHSFERRKRIIKVKKNLITGFLHFFIKQIFFSENDYFLHVESLRGGNTSINLKSKLWRVHRCSYFCDLHSNLKKYKELPGRNSRFLFLLRKGNTDWIKNPNAAGHHRALGCTAPAKSPQYL